MKKFVNKSPEQLVKQVETISTQYDLANDRSIVPPGLDSASVVEAYRESEEARAQWRYRFDLFRDLIRDSRNGGAGSAPEMAIKLEILNRIQAALGDHSTLLNNLFPHQRHVFSDLADFLEQGDSSGWIKMPTGSGKTAIFCSLAKIAGVKTLILVPKLNLIDQTIRSLEKFGGLDTSVSTVSGESQDTSGAVVICTYQSIQHILSSGESFPLVIGDEAHRMLTRSRLEAIQNITGKQLLIGLSATPKFSEEKSLDVIGKCIHELPITEAIRANIISGIRVVIATTTIDLTSVPRNASNGDYQLQQLAAAINTPPRNSAVIELLKQDIFSEKTTAISCVNIDHANALHELAVQAGLKAEVVHSQMDKKTKGSTLKSLDDGDIQFLFFVDQLTEGWDCPRAEILVNARPTQSIVVAEQRGGRVLRNHTFEDGRVKTHGLVIEILDRGTRPILMSDIVGGTFVLPESLSYEQSVKSENQKFKNNTPPDGVQIIFELEQIAETVRTLDIEGTPVRSLIEMNRDLVREIILNSGISKDDLSVPTRFLSTWFRHARFDGTGRLLVRNYFRDSKGLELSPITAAHYLAMCDQCDIGRNPKPTPSVMDRERVRKILGRIRLEGMKWSDFSGLRFDFLGFPGSGKVLVRDYYRDSKKQNIDYATMDEYLTMCYECGLLVPIKSVPESDWHKAFGLVCSNSNVSSFQNSPREFSKQELSEIIAWGPGFRFDRKSLFENLLEGNRSLSFGDLAKKVSQNFAETFQQALISSYLGELTDSQKIEVIKTLVLHHFPDSAPSWKRFSAVREYQIVDLIPEEIPCLLDATFKIDRSRSMSHQYLLGALGLSDMDVGNFSAWDEPSSSEKIWTEVIKDRYQYLDPLTEFEDYKFGLSSFAEEKAAQNRSYLRLNFNWADYHVSGARSESAGYASYDAFMKALFSTNGSDVVGFNDVLLRVGEKNEIDLTTFYRDLGLHALSARSGEMEAIIKTLLLKPFVGLPSLSDLQNIKFDIAAYLPDKYEIADGAFIKWDAGCGVNAVQLINALKLTNSGYEELYLRFNEAEQSRFQNRLKSLHESERAATTNQLHLESGLPDGTKLYIQNRSGEEDVVRMYQLTERYKDRSRTIKVTGFQNELVLSREFFDSLTGFIEMPPTTLDSAPILLSLKKLGEHIFSADAAGSNESEGLEFLKSTGGRVPDGAIITITDASGQKMEYALDGSDSRGLAIIHAKQKDVRGLRKFYKSELATSDGDLIFDDPKLLKEYRIPLRKAFEKWK